MSARSFDLAALGLLASVAACSGAAPAVVRPVEAAAITHASSTPPPGRHSDEEMRPPAATMPRREIPVVQQRNAASPIVTIRVLFEAGSSEDPAGREGATYVAARLMAEGGTEALSYEELTRRLFTIAASVRFHVDRDMTVFVAQVHRDHLEAFYPLVRDVLLHPRMARDDFRRVRVQTASELVDELRSSDDEALVRELLQQQIYAGHPYGHAALGTERGLAALTLDDVQGVRERLLCHDRVLLGLAGGYPEDFADRVRADLDTLPSRCAVRPALPDVARAPGVHVLVVDKPEASATAIAFGFPVQPRSYEDAAALRLVVDYLGLHRQSSGVLYQTLREQRGLNYGDYAYSEHFEQAEGTRFPEANIRRRQQYASIWIRPLRPDHAHFALRGAFRALGHAIEPGITSADFDRTRAFVNGYVGLYTPTESQQLGYALDETSTGSTANAPWADRLRGAWRDLTAERARAVAREYLTRNDVCVVVVGPHARELATAITSESPSPITYDTPKPASVLAEDREIERWSLGVRPGNLAITPIEQVLR